MNNEPPLLPLFPDRARCSLCCTTGIASVVSFRSFPADRTVVGCMGLCETCRDLLLAGRHAGLAARMQDDKEHDWGLLAC